MFSSRGSLLTIAMYNDGETPSFLSPNITKHGCTDCQSHMVSWACTKDEQTDERTSREQKSYANICWRG